MALRPGNSIEFGTNPSKYNVSNVVEPILLIQSSKSPFFHTIDKDNVRSRSFSKFFLMITVSELGFFSSSVLSKVIDIVKAHWIRFFRGSVMTVTQ